MEKDLLPRKKTKHFLLAMAICIYDVAIKCKIQTNHGSRIQISDNLICILPACKEFHLMLQQV